MNSSGPSLDFTRLEKARHHASGKVTARCPACAEEGRDRSGNHLAVFPDGRFACAACPGDQEHRRRIFGLAGIAGSSVIDPARREEWRSNRMRERRREQERRQLVDSVRARRDAIIARHPWNPADVWHDSPQIPDGPRVTGDPGHFLASLFSATDLLWTGAVHESGKPEHAARWQQGRAWQGIATSVASGAAEHHRIGPMTTPAVWQPGTLSRAAGNVLAAPYTVLDFDGMDGIKPGTPAELSRHLLDSLALVRWLREGLGWQLAAILWTGGKSLHAWFHTPPPAVLESLAGVAQSLGMDAGLIGRPEHPCRLPGQRHAGTGRISGVMWLA